MSSEYIYFYNDFNSHAHVERDPCGDLQQRYVENFNSHAHVERDILSCDPTTVNDISTHTLTWSVTFFLVLLVDLNDISTHTLTWSVTTGLDTLDDELLHFNSHAHVERDVLL